MSYWEVMRLPIRTFWLMSDSINRILAEKDLRSMSIAVSSQGNESVTKAHSNLVLELGDVIKGNPMNVERDPDAGAKLKALSML
jgi:hypothetical protein